jgi:hypothetical protein
MSKIGEKDFDMFSQRGNVVPDPRLLLFESRPSLSSQASHVLIWWNILYNCDQLGIEQVLLFLRVYDSGLRLEYSLTMLMCAVQSERTRIVAVFAAVQEMIYWSLNQSIYYCLFVCKGHSRSIAMLIMNNQSHLIVSMAGLLCVNVKNSEIVQWRPSHRNFTHDSELSKRSVCWNTSVSLF